MDSRYHKEYGKEPLEIPSLLCRRFAEGQVALFIGAGVSMAVDAPSWEKLVESLFRSFEQSPEDLEGLSLEQKMSFLTQRHGRLAVSKELDEQLYCERDLTVHKRLVSLPVPLILTTNYDRHLQEAAAAIGRPYRVIWTDSQVPLLFEARELTIVHLYGTTEYPLATEEDIINFDREHPALSLLLQHVLLTRTVLFLGFSFRDSNILNHILRTHTIVGYSRQGYAPTHYAYILDPHPRGMLEIWPQRRLEILATLFTTEHKEQDPHCLSRQFCDFAETLARKVSSFSYEQVERERMVQREEESFFQTSSEPIMRRESTFSVLALPDSLEDSGLMSSEGHTVGIQRRDIYRKWMRRGKIKLLLNCNKAYLGRRYTPELAIRRLEAIKCLLDEEIDNPRLEVGIRRNLDLRKGFASLGTSTLFQSDPPNSTKENELYKRTKVIRDLSTIEMFNLGFDREMEFLTRHACNDFDDEITSDHIRRLKQSNIAFIDSLLTQIRDSGLT